jgi:peptidoglycan/xylan/chitin deacetylase (PgdA/CDA1 family)
MKIIYAALTFDDGTLHQYFLAKLLHKLNIKSTLFLITGLKTHNDRQLLSGYPERISELSEWHEIASHSHTHRGLLALTSSDIKEELSKSKAFLEGITGKEVMGFAYPYYLFNDRVVEIVKRFYLYARAGRNVPDRWNIKFFNRYQIGSILKRDLPLVPFKLLKYEEIPVVMTFHDIKPFILLSIIKYLKGFLNCKFVTLSELLNYNSKLCTLGSQF